MNHFWPVTYGGKFFLLPLSHFQNGNIFFHPSLLLHEDALHRFDVDFFEDSKSVNKQTQGGYKEINSSSWRLQHLSLTSDGKTKENHKCRKTQ